MSIHFGIAAIAKTPELALDAKEAKQLAQAVGKVSELYNFDASEKTVAWCNLIACLAMVYGPRMIVIHGKSKAKKEMKKPVEKAPLPQAPKVDAPNNIMDWFHASPPVE